MTSPTKPTMLALGIGAAGAICLSLGAVAGGSGDLLLARAGVWVGAWAGVGCVAVSLAYAFNWPGVFGKVGGRLVPWRVALLLPYVVVSRIVCWLMRVRLHRSPCDRVAPGFYVGGRVRARDVPRDVGMILDLTSELTAPRAIREHPGYRCVPVLDGGVPPDLDAFLDVVCEVVAVDEGCLIHCQSGVGRAPTAAAVMLIAGRVVADVEAALELIRKGRPSIHPTRSDIEFIECAARRLG